jgi:hypothetical protein
MYLTYSLTFADFKAAQRLHTRQSMGRRMFAVLTFRVAPCLSVVILAGGAFFAVKGTSEQFAQCLSIGTALLFFSILMPIARYINERKGFKRLFPPSRTDLSCSIDLNDERIISAVPGVSEGKIFWPGVFRFAQDEKITLLYVAENRFFLFPTYALSQAQRAELNALVERHMVRR